MKNQTRLILFLSLVLYAKIGLSQGYTVIDLAHSYYQKAVKKADQDINWSINSATNALSYYEEALEDTTNQPDSIKKYKIKTYKLRASQKLLLADTIGVFDDYNSVLMLDSTSYDIILKKANLLFSSGNFDEALLNYKTIKDTLPESAIGEIGILLTEHLNMPEEGCKYLQEALEKYPKEKYIFSYMKHCRKE